jgi:tetratricopeptide (TPR) repeat protein
MTKPDLSHTATDLRKELNVSLISSGIAAMHKGDSAMALSFFERAHTMSQSPTACSFLGYCIAWTGGEIDRALALCEEALLKEPDNPVHYLNLGRICLLTGNKKDALKAFNDGLSRGGSNEIRDELKRLGSRKGPLLSFLGRSNPLNKYLGLTLKKLGLR